MYKFHFRLSTDTFLGVLELDGQPIQDGKAAPIQDLRRLAFTRKRKHSSTVAEDRERQLLLTCIQDAHGHFEPRSVEMQCGLDTGTMISAVVSYFPHLTGLWKKVRSKVRRTGKTRRRTRKAKQDEETLGAPLSQLCNAFRAIVRHRSRLFLGQRGLRVGDLPPEWPPRRQQ